MPFLLFVSLLTYRLFMHSICKNISTVFTYILIAFTWLCIKLNSRDFKVVTLPWQLLNRVIFKHINVKWNSGRTVIDSFATFFLLSFSKMSLMLFLPLYPQAIHNVNIINLSPTVTIQYYSDPSVSFSKEYLPFAAISITLFLFTVLPPVALLALYPFQWFRYLLFKCLPKRSIGPLNIFVEKFNNRYRDGLDDRRDMRSLATLCFISCLHFEISWSNSLSTYCTLWWLWMQSLCCKYSTVQEKIHVSNRFTNLC